jgi:hypothetical protein
VGSDAGWQLGGELVHLEGRGGGGGRDTDQRLIGIKGFRWEPEEQLLKVGIGHGGR